MWGLAAALYCYGFFQRVAPSVMVDELMRDFAVGAAITGTLSSLYFYAYASLQIPVGLMVDAFGPRRVLTISAAIAAAGSALFAVADTLWLAYLGRALIGAGAGFTWVATLTVAAAWFPPHRFAMVSGLTLAMGMGGAVFGQAPLALVIEAAGWRTTLAGAAVLAAALGALIWLVVRDRPPADPARPVSTEPPKGLLAGLGRAVRTRQTFVVALFGSAMSGPMLAFGGLWGVPYLTERFAIARPEAALVASAMMVGWAVGAPLGGWLSDRLGRRRLPSIAAATVALVSLTAALYLPGLPLAAVVVLLSVNGIAAGMMVLAFAVVREVNPPWAAGAAMGVANMAVMASGAVFQPLVGWLLDRAWDGTTVDGARAYGVAAFDAALWPLPALAAVALGAALMIKETRCRPIAG
jgi:MFS family permease